MNLMDFRSSVSSSEWAKANEYILNGTGAVPMLDGIVTRLPVEEQKALAVVLHNMLLVGFTAENISRIKRTFDVLEPLYLTPTLIDAFKSAEPTEFRWLSWIAAVHQRQKSNRSSFVPPTMEAGVGAFLLSYADCFPVKLKGTLNAMAEEDGAPLQWGRHFGLAVEEKPEPWRWKTLVQTIPDLEQRRVEWNKRVERNVLLAAAHENTSTFSTSSRKKM